MRRRALIVSLVMLVLLCITLDALWQNKSKAVVLVTPTEPVEQVASTDTDEPHYYLTEEEREIVECVVSGEAQAESYEGQVLVAQCILNACVKEGIQPSEVRVAYRYSGWNDDPSESVKKAVSAVFDDGYTLTDEPILYFYAPKWCTSEWHESQDFVLELDGHRFFKEKEVTL